jgi:predicted signal transduction protein with EAL and GGDEF domain
LYKLSWLIGDPDRPQEYTHHILLLAGIVMYLVAAIFNTVFVVTQLVFNLVLVLVAFSHLVIFYYSRFKGQFFIMSLVFLAIVIIFVLPANWFFNGGSEGPTLLLYLIAAFYLNYLLTDFPKSRLVFMAFVLVIPAVLLFSESSLQDWVYAYPDEQTKQLDLMFGYAITLGMSVFIMKMYGKRYRLQREKSDRLAKQLKVLAETDSLTQLYNRNAFARLYDNVEDKAGYSLVMLDLDHFKQLNDTFGHQVGDEVLIAY